MNHYARNTQYLSKLIEGFWTVTANALGEDHLLSQAFETALRSGDAELMERALALFGGYPKAVQNRILWGVDAVV